MDIQKIIDYCLTKENSYVDLPFGEIPVCVKCDGHIFAEIYPDPGDLKITLRCDPVAGDYFREKFGESIKQGYHVPANQRKFKYTLLLDRKIPDKEIRKMIDLSYDNLVKVFKKKSKSQA